MQLATGSRLGPYEIVSRIGSGGMGEVFRARDTRLDRSVAIKVLSDDFAGDPRLRLRFEREARTISQLNHPHICTLHDVGDNYLVLELLDGETLSERLLRGPLPLRDVIRYGAQIADALDRAHRAGITHRDLKPANVMLTKTGAKLLDFGLAKSASGIIDVDGVTQHKPLTQEGTILGTFQYMAPEQLEGAEADARTDLFALGALLYELATGKRAFEGKTKTSLIAAIVSGEPAPMSQIQPLTPPAFEHIVMRCLAKDPDDRWQSAHDVAQELRWIADVAPATGAQRASKARQWLPWCIAAAATAAVLALMLVPRGTPPRPMRLSFRIPDTVSLYPFDELGIAVSPDGKRVVYATYGETRKKQLWVRALGAEQSQALPGSEGAFYPFWSPDGTEIGFFADGKLKKLDLRGGPPTSIADAPASRGGAWGGDGTIVFSDRPAGPLYRVSSAGGKATPLTKLGQGEISHRWPQFHPDGKHVLYVIRKQADADATSGTLNVVSIEDGASKEIASGVSNGAFAGPDLLVYARGGTIFAQRFDARSLALTGERMTVAADAAAHYDAKTLAVFSVSHDGTLVFVPAPPESSALQMVDRYGRQVEKLMETPSNPFARMTRDGQRIAYVQREGDAYDLWIYDRSGQRRTRLTFEGKYLTGPVWSADGGEIAFQYGAPLGQIGRKRVDSGGAAEPFITSAPWKYPGDYSADGRWFLYFAQSPKGELEMWSAPLTKESGRTGRVGSGRGFRARFSPDSRFLVYASDATGRFEIYVKSFPDGARQWQLSTSGGIAPIWRGDGREIFYTTLDGTIMAVPVSTASGFRAGAPEPLFSMAGSPLGSDGESPISDVTPDGQLFLFRKSPSPREQIDVMIDALPPPH